MHLNLAPGAVDCADPTRAGLPPPISFPDVDRQERARENREAVRLGNAARNAEAVKRLIAQAKDKAYDQGYGDGGRTGLLIGFITGGLTCGIVGAVVYGLRAWMAAQ